MHSKQTFPHKWDWELFILVFILTGIGLMMVFSSSFVLAQKQYGDPYFFLKRQGFYAFIGIILMLGMIRYIPYQLYQRLTYPLLCLAIIGLILVFVPGIGRKINNATRWIRVGHFSLQPSEFAKIAFISYLAAAVSREEKIKQFSVGILPTLIIYSIFAGLLLAEPDMGTVLLLASLTFCMLFLGGAKIKHLFIITCPGIAGLFYLLIKAPYRLKRLLAFLHPENDPLGVGYVILHSKLAFASGGFWGQGLGASQQKLFYLPEPFTDYIFSILGEELGFWGVAFITFLFALLIWRGINIARGARDLFGFYLALGITLWLSMQTIIHMGVCLGLLPPKGITLPFISYGGSALLANFMAIGILENIHAQGQR
ncbi:MAG: putative lipid II flippase FtsW [Candidatus Desulfofervidaceae bacterium]|nr:putative lipid II flippase FtsW [Candidatus Desulfofervidaceae bacterium]MDL1969633.1 putative lipid II flippase FtsW [Candidatus Desulfofervidaceae bacterium]